MTCSCCVAGCTNASWKDLTSKRRDRIFVKFHQCPLNRKLRTQWDRRLRRDQEEVSQFKSYNVCSEHFSDADYNAAHLLRVRTMGYRKRQALHLKPDAVPNTVRETGEADYGDSRTKRQKRGPNIR